MSTIDRANGKWHGIFQHFGIEVRFNKHQPCPTCGGKDRFRFDDKKGSGSSYCTGCGARSGMQLLMDWLGVDFKEAANQVDKILGVVKEVRRMDKTSEEKLREFALNAKNFRHIQGTPAEEYLASRGLEPVIYLKSWGENMVAKIIDRNNEPIGYHVTFPSQKKRLVYGTSKGMIQLTPLKKHIGIAEGIETALSAMKLFRVPCWAVVSAMSMRDWEPPKGVEEVTVYGDNDESFTGHMAAYTLAWKLKNKGLKVNVRISPYGDWNDIVQNSTTQNKEGDQDGQPAEGARSIKDG